VTSASRLTFSGTYNDVQDVVDEEGWKEVVFIPPGMATLGQLEKMRTTIG
jgi:hypothetical protein